MNVDSLSTIGKKAFWIWWQADADGIVTQPITDYGRQISSSSLMIDWDCGSNMKAVSLVIVYHLKVLIK